MKAPEITQPVIGYNVDGKRHRATHEALVWLSKEMDKATETYNDRSKEWARTTGVIEEMELLEQDAVLETLKYVYSYLLGQID